MNPIRVSDPILRRIYILFGCFLLFTVLIILQLVRVQYLEGDHWIDYDHSHKVYYKQVVADRGSILADDGSILAATLPYFRIALDGAAIREEDYENFEDSLQVLCQKLASFHGKNLYSADFFRQRIQNARKNRDRHFYLFPVSEVFNYQEMKRLCQFPILNRKQYDGGAIVEKIHNKRFYPFKDLGRITLGLLKDDTIGVRGLEASFNKILRGKDGYMLVQRIAGNTEVPIEEFGESETVDGLDIQTTINVNMQDVVETELKRAVEAHSAKAGIAILMETATGQIKALANYPDNLNMAVSQQYEPGSTFKIASAIAALEEGIIELDDTINTYNGEYEYYDRIMKDVHPLGKVTFREAFEKSSNIGISQVIYRHYRKNPVKFVEQLKQMGVLSPTGFQIRGEQEPYLITPDNPNWNGTTLPWLATGYNIKLTPLQLLTFVNAIANNGKMMR
ncbi:MAG: penicillin-binding transpeptidase domain-containing protein, partial [Bacteroidia bacterium]|nr:penicillin-binding transpeptidase domain-containing protein [Bacteroidia bacterium]